MQVPFKPIEFLSRDIKVERRGDGTVVLQSNHPLEALCPAHPGAAGEVGGARRRTGCGWRSAAGRTGTG